MKTIRSILAAADLAQTTPMVLRTADTLAHATGAELNLVHALELDWLGFPEAAPTFQELFDQAASKLDAAAVRSLHKVEPASSEVVLYARHRTIADRAREVEADLIVIGPHRHHSGLLGTTADRLLRTARCPCWITQRAVRLPLEKIIIATDLSVAGHAALDAAATIVQTLGRAIPPVEAVLLHITSSPLGSPVAAECRRMLEDQAAGWVTRYKLAERVRVRTSLGRASRPARGIIAYLNRSAPDLLVIGTHGHSAVDRLLLGSVATRVLREAPCDALVAPPKRIS